MRLDELLRHPPLETLASGRRSTPSEPHRAASRRAGRQRQRADRPAGDRAGDPPVRVAARPIRSCRARSARSSRACRSRRCASAWPTTRCSTRTSIRYGACSTASARPARATRASRIRACRPSSRSPPRSPRRWPARRRPTRALFRRGLNRIDVFLSEQLQGQLRAAQAAVDALQLAERREILQQHLAQRLTDQMVAVRTSPTIRRFVTGTWARVIAEDMLRHGEQSEQTMSDAEDGRRPAVEPEDPRPPAEPAAPDRAPARPAAAPARRHGVDRAARRRAAGRPQRADGDPHRGAASRARARTRRAHPGGDRAADARRGRCPRRRRRAASAIR